MKRSAASFFGRAGTRALVIAAIISASAALSVTSATLSIRPNAPPAPPEPVCPVGYNFTHGECTVIAPPTTCPDGYLYSEGECVLKESPTPEPIPDVTPAPDPDPTADPIPDPIPDPEPEPDPTPSVIPFGELHGVNYIDRILVRNEGANATPVRPGQVDKLVEKAKESGFNVFRVPVAWESYVDNKATFLKELDYLVSTANKHEIYVWIVFFQYDASSHWPWKVSPFGVGFPKYVVSCYQPIKDYEMDLEIREFWDDYYSNKVRDSSNSCKRTLDVWTLQAGFMEDIINVVDKYPNLIGYELINEPHVWKDSHYDRLGDLHTWFAKELRKSTDKVLIFTRETTHGLKSDGTVYLRKPDLQYKILPKDPAKNVMFSPHLYDLNEIEKHVSQWKELKKKWASMGYDVKISVGEWAAKPPQLTKGKAVTQQNIDRFVSVWEREGWMHTYWAYGGFADGEGRVLVEYSGDLTSAGEYLAKAITKYYDD
ncbi:MAG: cellulase family glycosylhydrolase [Nitrososphaera sp.]